MMFSIYSLPAILALIAKIVVFYFSRHSPVKDFKTRLFQLALAAAIVLGVIETLGLNLMPRMNQRLFDVTGFSWYIAIICTLVPMSHLAIAVTFGARRLSNILAGLLYGYALVVIALMLFTPLVIKQFDVLDGYTITRVSGPWMGLLEILLFAMISILIVLPFYGLRSSRPAISRNQCKMWIAGAVPANLLLLTVIVLLHFGIRLFNFSVTGPLLLFFMLVTVGYAVHTRRPIELDFYFPWSRVRRRKQALYRRIERLTQALSSLRSPERVLQRLARTLRCPVCLVYPDRRAFLATGDAAPLTAFPVDRLVHIEHMIVTAELPESEATRRLFEQHRIGAIVPFFPKSQAACWLLLDRKFSSRIYSAVDFSAVAVLFDRLAVLLLDKMLDEKRGVTPREGELGEWRASQERLWKEVDKLLPASPKAEPQSARSLDDYVADFEKQLIERVLRYCNGHQSNTARILGLNPSTLHYKLERYGLVVPLYRRKSPKVG